MTPIQQTNGLWGVENPDTGEIIARDFATLGEAQQFIALSLT